MKIIQKLLLIAFVVAGIISCTKKGDLVSPVSFGKIEIVNKTIFGPDSIFARINDKDMLPGYARTGSSNIQVIPQNNYKLSFYKASNPDKLLLEANVTVEHGKTTSISLFSLSEDDPLKLLEFEDVEEPKADEVKISIANFSTNMPDNLDIEILVMTSRRPFRYITVGRIENVGRQVLDNKFSTFVTVPVTKNTADQIVYGYMLAPIDRNTGEYFLPDNLAGSFGTAVEFTEENRIIRAYIFGDGQQTDMLQF
ncbi:MULTISPECIES: hypothetical protein [Sphingobacterium]|uniref:hypothetical protein n=1 Tax=Sphingobacterium TaxID=28453 RepID=UPI0021A39C47|nr:MULTISPECIES: hypothetical protein [Sphingobacterium]MCT1525031.1 hypothetical protein [Sphingobacterium hotanense]